MRPLPTLLLLLLLLTACGTGGSQTRPTPESQPTPTAEPSSTGGSQTRPAATESRPASREPSPTAAEATPLPESTATSLPSPTPSPEPSPSPVARPDFDPAAISLELETVVEGLTSPLAAVHAGDGSGRLFIVEKGGRIKVLQNGSLLPELFLDVSRRISNGSEQGLLGMAFEPGRPERFYINYTDTQGDTVIARYRTGANPNIADAASEEILLTVEQPASNHNGGNLAFGPDGYLWIGLGDGGAAGDQFRNGQNPETLLGSMLRLDVSGEQGYVVPPDNPFASGEGGAAEIWAIGLRNPWRYSFDRLTGDLWLADVGQGQTEEVNRVPSTVPALNFGWPILEGSHCYNTPNCSTEGLVLPVTEYNTRRFGCAVTGGYVYRGEAFPALYGGYFFSDYCSGILWAIPANTETLIEPTIVLESGNNVSSFGEDEAGELYLTTFEGVLYRLVSR